MTIIFRFNFRDENFLDRFNRLKYSFPKAIGVVGHEYCEEVAKQVRIEAINQNLIWRGKMVNSIRAEKLSKFRSVVKIRKQGMYLDRMRPHYVKLKRGRLIRQWAYNTGNPVLIHRADNEYSIYVRPHPFIDKGRFRAQHKLLPLLRAHTERTIREAMVR